MVNWDTEEEDCRAATHLRALMECTSDFIMIADAEGFPVVYNKAYAETIQAALGVEMRVGFQPHKHLPDPEKVAWWDDLHRRVLGGEQFVIEVAQEFEGGTVRHFSFSFSPIIEDGQVTGFCEISREITAAKQVEIALRESEHRLLESQAVARIGSYLLNVSDGTWTSSPILDDIFGIDGEQRESQHTMVGWVSLVHEDWREGMLRYFNDEVLAKGVDFDKEYMIRRLSDGVSRWVHGLGRLRFNDAGEVVAMIGTIRDITENKELEQRVRQQEKMKAIGQLAGGVAHDFNNQLVGILGFADILREEASDNPRLANYADNIILAARRASDLTAQLLAFSRKGSYLSVPVDVHDIVGEVVDILSHSVDKRIHIDKRLRATSRVTRSDPSQLQSAILNLGLNACDAMPDGGALVFTTDNVMLDVADCERSHFTLLPGSYLRVRVSDTGIGMSLEVQQRVFEPFFTTKARGQGTGMGLAAVYGTAKNHRGAALIESEPGRGTTVTLTLPVDAHTVAGEMEAPEVETPEAGPARILIVDDERIVRIVASRMLSKLGYETVCVRNGAEAVKAYDASFDLVLLDLVMPVMGGRETYRALSELDPGVRVLLVSGYSLDGEAQTVLDEGAAGFIQKPFRLAHMATKVAELLEQK